ncbi:MAG: filamentous hemagglutinin N-terminal domain-containing protein [Cyanobacteria bacterium J06621_8]
MMGQILSRYLKIAVLALGYLLSSTVSSSAQVTTDGTVNTQVNQNGNIAEITGGETRGNNLFHSFQDFSVSTGSEAFFNNAASIEHIFSRVTGGNVSNIDGLMRANGNASLFLINPAGIVLGENARLDLGGSFYGSTASSILFEDGQFSAADLENPPLLTVNAPIGLSFRDNPADITVRGDGNGTRLADNEPIDTLDALRVGEDATIGLIGGNLNFESATVKTAGGRIELGSVAGGRVGIVAVANGLSFDYSATEAFQDITLSGTFSAIDASGNGGGDINLAGRNILINGSSAIEANTLGDQAGGDINIFAADTLSLSSVENANGFISGISNRVFANATADGGNIRIETGSLSIGDRSAITTSSFGQGNPGNITINANGSVSLNNQGALVTNNLGAGAGGNITISTLDDVSLSNSSGVNVLGSPGGSIEINAKNLSLVSGSTLFAGVSNGSEVAEVVSGDIKINLLEDLIFDEAGSGDFTAIIHGSGGQGNSGNTEISARNMLFKNGAGIVSFSTSGGNLGDITLNATGNISFDGANELGFSGVNTANLPGSSGDIGSVNIAAQNFNLINGGSIASNIIGIGDSGDINLNIVDTITVEGFGLTEVAGFPSNFASRIATNIRGIGIGNSGNINVNTNNLFLARSGSITTDIFGQGNAGNVNITANAITLDGALGEVESPTPLLTSEISSESFSELGDNPAAEANAGNLLINTNTLSITNGAGIEANNSTIGKGNVGEIKINATESVSIDGSTTRNNLVFDEDITAESFLNDGILPVGRIDGERIVRSGIFASITDAETTGNAGNIEINTPQLSITNQAQINTFTRGLGDAGSITLNVDQLTLRDGAINIVTTGQGNGGLLNISATESIKLFDNSDIDGRTRSGSTGNGGDIDIMTGELIVTDGSQIATSTFGQGSAGDLNINASELIDLRGVSTDDGSSSGLFASALVEDGNGGNVQIITGDLTISDGATINVSNFPSVEGLQEPGTGEAGSLIVEADSLQIENGGRINAATQAGDGGNITLQIADNITLQDSGLISAEALEDANGGNINIDTNFIVAFPNGNNDIIATAERGNGGNININAESLLGIQQRPLNNATNDINASSEFSLDGTVTINTPDTNSVQGEINLPENVIETQDTVAQTCRSNRELAAQNSFTISGKGGIPNEPAMPFDSQNISINGEYNFTSIIPQAIETIQGKIQLARGIRVAESGAIILTAYPTNNQGERVAEGLRNCG